LRSLDLFLKVTSVTPPAFATHKQRIRQRITILHLTQLQHLTPPSNPIPGACPTGTIFDVTQALIGGDFPIGTVLCLTTAGTNLGITAIVPGPQVFTGSNILVVQALVNGECQAGTFAAAVASGVLPRPLSGTTVSVALLT